MRNKLIFLTGVGVGYVLGTRAGREKYDQIVAQARRFWESPTVQEAAGVVQAQATKMYGDGKQAMSDQVHKLSRTKGGQPAETSESAGESWDTPTGQNEFSAKSF